MASDNVEIKEQYQALEELVQGYVQYFFNVQAQGLTSTELVAQLAQHDIQANEKEALAQVFERGQNCRYAPENGTEWEESFRLDLKQIKQFCT